MKTLKEKRKQIFGKEGYGKYIYSEEDVKEFIKELRMFIKDKTMIASSNEGTNVTLIRFFPFEFEEFLKQIGDLE